MMFYWEHLFLWRRMVSTDKRIRRWDWMWFRIRSLGGCKESPSKASCDSSWMNSAFFLRETGLLWVLMPMILVQGHDFTVTKQACTSSRYWERKSESLGRIQTKFRWSLLQGSNFRKNKRVRKERKLITLQMYSLLSNNYTRSWQNLIIAVSPDLVS